MGAEFCETPARLVKRSGDGRLLYKARLNESSLLDLVEYGFVREDGEAPTHHQLAVWDLEGGEETPIRIVAIISQSDIIRFLHRHEHSLRPHISELKLSAMLPLAPDAVLSVAATVPTLEALSIMRTHNRSVVGITDGVGGPLTGALSPADLRGLKRDQWQSLALPVSEFIAVVRPSPAHGVRGYRGGEPRLLTASPAEPLSSVLAILADEGVHHVFVTDAMTSRALAVVTPFDVLRFIVVETAV